MQTVKRILGMACMLLLGLLGPAATVLIYLSGDSTNWLLPLLTVVIGVPLCVLVTKLTLKSFFNSWMAMPLAAVANEALLLAIPWAYTAILGEPGEAVEYLGWLFILWIPLCSYNLPMTITTVLATALIAKYWCCGQDGRPASTASEVHSF